MRKKSNRTRTTMLHDGSRSLRTRPNVHQVKSFVRVAWIVLVIMKLCVASAIAHSSFQNEEQVAGKIPVYKNPVIIKFEGVIDWNTSTYLHNRIKRAKKRGADLLIVDINSPGGLVSESLRIGETLSNIDWAHTVAYVPKTAVSGAALFSLGCDEIIVSEKSSFGDIGAIQYDPELFAFRYVPAKAQSILITEAKLLAESKNRPPQFAEAMIDKDMLLFVGKGNNEGQFTTARLQDKSQTPKQVAEAEGLSSDDWELVAESGVERFLTLTGSRAVELGLASVNLESQDELLEYLEADQSRLVSFKYNATDSIVSLLNNPIITGLLVIIGIIALYIEFSAPGLGAGGLIALLCAVIFFWSRFMGGTSGVLEVLLFVCGVIFILMEIFVIPGWGISGFAGLGLILISAVMAGLDFVFPESPSQWNQLITNVLLILCSGVTGLIALTWIARKMGSIPVLNRLILSPHKESKSTTDGSGKAGNKPAVVPHPIVSVGDWGIADSVLRPAGRARFGHESIDVVSEGSFIDPGDQIKVVEINGNRIVVAAIDSLDDTIGA